MNPYDKKLIRFHMAATAPDVPTWFEHTPPAIDYPPMPDYMTLDETHQETVRQWQQDGCFDLPEELQWFGKKVVAHRVAREAWNKKNNLARLVQWRFAYADAMLEQAVQSYRDAIAK